MIIRPGTARDTVAIKAIIRGARINPIGLDWRRFLVVEDAGRIIGTGQIKPHADRSRELASIAVVPDRQHRGVASAIIYALLAQAHGTLFLTCEQGLQPFYVRFGFRPVAPAAMTPYFRRITGVINGMLRLTRQPERLTVMIRQGS